MKKDGSERILFMKLDQEASEIFSSGDRRVCLNSFSNIAVQQFSFPFSGISKVKEALRLQLRPLLGNAAADVSMIPFFLENDRKGSSGCVFLLFESADDGDRSLDQVAESENTSVWPTPLLFASQVDGNGIVSCTSDGSISTVLLSGWTPKYYATAPADTSDMDQEIDAAQKFAESQSIDISGGIFSSELDTMSQQEIQSAGEETIAKCRAYALLDLSNRGMDALEMREKLAARMLKIGRVLAAAGVVFLAIAGAAFFRFSRLLDASRENTQQVYFNSFGERSNQPLSAARAKVRSMTSTGDTELTLTDIIKSISFAWTEVGAPDEVIVENIRFGSENTDIIGTAENNESIQRMRALLEEDGLVPKIDNIQRIPSGSLRFNISITKGAKQ